MSADLPTTRKQLAAWLQGKFIRKVEMRGHADDSNNDVLVLHVVPHKMSPGTQTVKLEFFTTHVTINGRSL